MEERPQIEVDALAELDKSGKRGLRYLELAVRLPIHPEPDIIQVLLDLEASGDVVVDGLTDSYKCKYICAIHANDEFRNVTERS